MMVIVLIDVRMPWRRGKLLSNPRNIRRVIRRRCHQHRIRLNAIAQAQKMRRNPLQKLKFMRVVRVEASPIMLMNPVLP